MPTREDIIIQNVKPFLPSHARVLEIGAGNGLVAEVLQDATHTEFTLLDVVNYNRSRLPLTVYDGMTLPFEENAFDLVLFIFVLHHNPDPRPLLRQALCVARHGVLVVENDTRGFLKRPLTRLIDSTEFLRRGVPPNYFVKSTDEWLEYFRALPARANLLHTFKIGWYWNNVVLKVERV